MKYRKGNIVKGIVSGVTEYGIFVKLDDTYNGLIHISEISSRYVRHPNEYAKVNEMICAKVLDIDNDTNHIKLSIKNMQHKNEKRTNKVMIRETSHGFKTLAYNLPNWIQEGLNFKKNSKFVDKCNYK